MPIFTSQDFFVIGFLVFLEGVLSIDNALVLAMLARDLPREQQKRALTYGLIGAVVFRLIALTFVTYLMNWNWVKFVGGGYLIFIACRHFLKRGPGEEEGPPKTYGAANFWKVVLVIELTDIAFAVDSILAAIALSSKFWVVFTGGIIGVALMRFAATKFIVLLERFPRFENTAYLLVLTIGIKVVIEGFHPPSVDFHSPSNPYFWGFWAIMGACIVYGLLPHPNAKKPGAVASDEASGT